MIKLHLRFCGDCCIIGRVREAVMFMRTRSACARCVAAYKVRRMAEKYYKNFILFPFGVMIDIAGNKELKCLYLRCSELSIEP